MKKLYKKRNTDFELLKKIMGKIQLSKIRAMFLVLGVLVSSITLIVKVVVSKNLYFLFVQVIRYCSVPDVSIHK